jgi:hypothetical protein
VNKRTASLSGVTTNHDGHWLWVAPDEGRKLIRLRTQDGGYGDPVEIELGDDVLPNLPGEEKDELDIEGLDISGNVLWFTGSHSAVRKKVKDPEDVDKAPDRLAKVDKQPSRQVIGRLELTDGAEGLLPRPRGDHALLGPDAEHPLVEQLADDPWIGPFVKIPGKDNGLDVEGLAVCGENVVLGLRGPVLRGWAVLLTVHPVPADGNSDQLRLKAVHGHRYSLHFANLGGLGVRDLCRSGEDLLVLAGPTMLLDEPFRVHRIVGGATGQLLPSVLPEAMLRVIAKLPVEPDQRELATFPAEPIHPEGITVLADGQGKYLLVVDDNAHPERDGTVQCRLVTLPARKTEAKP